MATITEDYVSYEIAKLLKEKGFTEMCSRCYGISVRHNGKDIDEDEEYELKSNGKGNEIEYVDGGQLYCMHDNNSFSSSVYAAPTHQMAMKWLRNKGIYIQIRRNINTYLYGAIMLQDGSDIYATIPSELETYEQTVEAALRYSLENLI